MTKILEVKRTDLWKIDVRAIEVDPSYNVRTVYNGIEELASSILQNGVQVPLMVKSHPSKKDRYILVRGHRRLKACMSLLEKGKVDELRVPAQLAPRFQSEIDLLLDQEISNSGEQLTPIEKSELVKRAIKLGLTEKEVAEKLGKSITFVNNLVILGQSSKEIKDMIKDGKISSSLVVDILKKNKDFDSAVQQIQELNSYSIKSGKEKITKKVIDASENKFNSLSYFKKMIKANEKSEHQKTVRPDRVKEYEFALRLISGNLTAQEMENYFFDNAIVFETEEA